MCEAVRSETAVRNLLRQNARDDPGERDSGIAYMSGSNLKVWYNCRLAPQADPDHIIENAAIVVLDGRIDWFGPPRAFAGAER